MIIHHEDWLLADENTLFRVAYDCDECLEIMKIQCGAIIQLIMQLVIIYVFIFVKLIIYVHIQKFIVMLVMIKYKNVEQDQIR